MWRLQVGNGHVRVVVCIPTGYKHNKRSTRVFATPFIYNTQHPIPTLLQHTNSSSSIFHPQQAAHCKVLETIMVKIGFNSDKRLLSFASVCAALLLPLCAAESYSDWFTGDGTYYGPISNGNGNCAMRGSLPGGVYDGMIAVAINGEQYESSKMCGACIEGTASGKGSGNHPLPRSFKAYVIDQCPGCGKGKWPRCMARACVCGSLCLCV